MKKLLSVALIAALILMQAAAIAEVDIQGLSYDELAALVNEAQMLMMQSDKWQEAEVPVGTYLIGRDIPAGRWTIACSEEYTAQLLIGSNLTEYGTVESSVGNYSIQLIGRSCWLYEEGHPTFVTWELKEGLYIQINAGSAYFTPYRGNSFTFK